MSHSLGLKALRVPTTMLCTPAPTALSLQAPATPRWPLYHTSLVPWHHWDCWHQGTTSFTQQHLQQMQGEVATTSSPPAENKSIDQMFPQEGDGDGAQSLKRPLRPPSPHFTRPPASHLTCNTLFTAGRSTHNTLPPPPAPVLQALPEGPCIAAGA